MMPLFQVQYRKNSHTYQSDIEAENKDAVLSFFNSFVVAEVLEIREYVYSRQHYPIDDGNYSPGLSFILSDDGRLRKIVLKKIKKNLKVDDLFLHIKSYLRFRKSSKFSIKSLNYFS